MWKVKFNGQHFTLRSRGPSGINVRDPRYESLLLLLSTSFSHLLNLVWNVRERERLSHARYGISISDHNSKRTEQPIESSVLYSVEPTVIFSIRKFSTFPNLLYIYCLAITKDMFVTGNTNSARSFNE